MSEASKAILKFHNLRVTDCRVDVIQHFIDKKGAFSHRDLEVSYEQYDRVTIYRTLNNLIEVGILHKIPSESSTATYGLCDSANSSEEHFDNHVHFKCNRCGQIECLPDKEVPQISVPEGYTVKKANLILDGTCPSCS